MFRPTRCPDEGALRAYLDGQSSPAETAGVERHLARCPHCAARSNALRVQSALVYGALGRVPTPNAATPAAWRHFEARRQLSSRQPFDRRFENMVQTLRYRHRRIAVASAMLVLALIAVMAVDPLRSAAAQFLGIFRVQKIAVVEFNPAQLDRFESFQDKIFSRPETTKAKPVDVTSVEQASQLAGFKVMEPDTQAAKLSARSKFQVEGEHTAKTVVNLAAARALLQSAELPTDSIPAGETLPVTAKIAPVVVMRYSQGQSAVSVVQARSPEVDVPEGMDMQALGEVGLRLLGMPEDQARQFSQSVNWATTLVVPVPKNDVSVRQVSVHGANGYLMQDKSNKEGSVVFWEADGILYAVQGKLNATRLVAVAESLK